MQPVGNGYGCDLRGRCVSRTSCRKDSLPAMNKIMLWRALMAALVLWLWVAQAPPPTRAHPGPPRVELVADQLNPGATLEVQGINIAPEQQVTLALVQSNLEIPLGLAVGDQHGDFTAVFVLPKT